MLFLPVSVHYACRQTYFSRTVTPILMNLREETDDKSRGGSGGEGVKWLEMSKVYLKVLYVSHINICKSILHNIWDTLWIIEQPALKHTPAKTQVTSRLACAHPLWILYVRTGLYYRSDLKEQCKVHPVQHDIKHLTKYMNKKKNILEVISTITVTCSWSSWRKYIDRKFM